MIRRGSYVMVVTLHADKQFEVGALGPLDFRSGMYFYVGSAKGGLDQRISRHMSEDKPLRWHIDYLTVNADVIDAYVSYPDAVPECDLAKYAVEVGMEQSHKGFGCSDRRCRTHLFEGDERSLSRLVSLAGLKHFD